MKHWLMYFINYLFFQLCKKKNSLQNVKCNFKHVNVLMIRVKYFLRPMVTYMIGRSHFAQNRLLKRTNVLDQENSTIDLNVETTTDIP